MPGAGQAFLPLLRKVSQISVLCPPSPPPFSSKSYLEGAKLCYTNYPLSVSWGVGWRGDLVVNSFSESARPRRLKLTNCPCSPLVWRPAGNATGLLCMWAWLLLLLCLIISNTMLYSLHPSYSSVIPGPGSWYSVSVLVIGRHLLSNIGYQ